MHNIDRIGISPFPEQPSEVDQINGLKAKRTNFIFLFGKAGVGKTAITASLINYLASECEQGNIERVGNHEGKKLGERIRYVISRNMFPDRTRVGSLTQVDCRFVPSRRGLRELDFTFLEMSGEDLEHVDVNSDGHEGKLPDNIDVFFKAEGLSLTFILVTSHDQAATDDSLMVNFIDYLADKSPVYRDSRVLLLISKWDEALREHPNLDVEEFIRDNMRQTFKKINRSANAFRYFTLGTINEVDGHPHISKYAPESAERVFEWLYRSLTGRPLRGRFERLRRLLLGV
jgi:GTPase SAR1 family protein